MAAKPSHQRPPRPCPVCGSSGGREILFHQRFVDDPLGTGGYDVAICDRCGAGFADGIPTQAELDQYYAERSKYEYAHAGGEESPYDVKRFEAIADHIESFLPARDKAILDVGCATGGLLACLGRRGYRRLEGGDPSAACVAAAARLHGVAATRATIGEMGGWEKRFDLILLVGVLEHLREPADAVRRLAGLLFPGGAIYCAQPDVAAFADCVNAPYQQFSVEHVNFFSEGSLRRLMGGGGLGPVRSWAWMVEWREKVTDSVLSGLFSPSVPPGPEAPDGETRAGLRRYLDRCGAQERELTATVDRLVQGGRKVLVWGAGTLARRLLATSRLGEAAIVAFVDSNPHLHGEVLAGRPILAPSQLKGYDEPILICSRAFEREITQVIRGELGLKNPILLMEM